MLAFRGEAGGGGNDLKKIGHAKATAEVLQIFNELMGSNHQTTNSESMAPQDFGRSVNPIHGQSSYWTAETFRVYEKESTGRTVNDVVFLAYQPG